MWRSAFRPCARTLLALACAGSLAGPAAAQAKLEDRDHDRLPDRWERTYRLSTTRPSDKGDADRDGLSNLREYRAKTNPRKRDTDGDGLSDGAEVKRYRTNPRKRDTDGDGVSDGAEVKRGTNPRKRDARASAGGAAPPVATPLTAPPSPPDLAAPAPAAAQTAGFPSAATAGVPAGWTPQATLTTDLVVTRAGTVVQDVKLVGADLLVRAPDVTVRRVLLQGGRIDNLPGNQCQNGLRIEDSTFEPPPGQTVARDGEGAVGIGGYTATRVKIWRRSEGFRVGGRTYGCGPVRIESSFASIAVDGDDCASSHADGIQGYGGPPLTVVDVTIDFRDADCGTAPFFVPEGQGNVSATVDGLLLAGGGIPFRLGVPGSVRGLRIVDRTWGYRPVEVDCDLLSGWDAQIVSLDAAQQPTGLRPQPCGA